jgi:hypothetical protein
MPRSPSSAHTTTEDLKKIDLDRLRRGDAWKLGQRGRLTWFWNGEERGFIIYQVEQTGLRLLYRTRQKGETQWHDVDELVRFAFTDLSYGHRPWFLCPDCNRRCKILYDGGGLFRCRKCVGAAYESQYERLPIRISNTRWKIRGWMRDRGAPEWSSKDIDRVPNKPKWMRWSTYNRLKRRDGVLEEAWSAAVGSWLRTRKR